MEDKKEKEASNPGEATIVTDGDIQRSEESVDESLEEGEVEETEELSPIPTPHKSALMSSLPLDVSQIMESIFADDQMPQATIIPADSANMTVPIEDDDDSGSGSDFMFSDNEVVEERKQVEQKHHSDSDDEEGGGTSTGAKRGVRTKNEIDVLPPVEPIDVEIPSDAPLKEVGTISGHVESQVIIQSTIDGESQVLDADTIILLQDRTIVGKIYETFGPVICPFYSVRFNTPEEIDEKFKIGTKVYFIPFLAKFVLTAHLRSLKGSDASNIHDEEVDDNELEFSDDEKEAEYKRAKKEMRRANALNADDDKKPKSANWKDRSTDVAVAKVGAAIQTLLSIRRNHVQLHININDRNTPLGQNRMINGNQTRTALALSDVAVTLAEIAFQTIRDRTLQWATLEA
ncbi:hypothetical protein HDU97_006401 [Phlyctochytrium planicorne]|nr:hypothetical protein HDU97_006401 [Phlyctochytrium planicorne]